MRIVTQADLDNAYSLGRKRAQEDIDENPTMAVPPDLFEEHDPMEIVIEVTGVKDIDDYDDILIQFEEGYTDQFFWEPLEVR